ncbi:hypothetical protein AGOR_G00041110 [Albula goreensis]|uniref:Transmembrane protein 108 n=1 Tax=Albula goreensis TaxID=1534307 RepID=A0A8T3E5E0_9TELE|nr:hypothetical protein AGOR_G00041110 [Albula goreensis]
MTTSLQVLRCRLLSVLAILVLPSGRVSQELHPRRAPHIPRSPTMTLSSDVPAWQDSRSLESLHTTIGGSLDAVEYVSKEEVSVKLPTDSGRSYSASELQPSSSSSISSTAVEQEHRGPAHHTLDLVRPHSITLREVHSPLSDGNTAPHEATPPSPVSAPSSPSTNHTAAGSDVTANETSSVSPIGGMVSNRSADNGSTVSHSRGDEPPPWDTPFTTGPTAASTSNLLNRLFPTRHSEGSANQTDPALEPPRPHAAICLGRVDIVWMVLVISVPVASCSVLLTVCCMRRRKRKKASGQESSLSYWNDAITMDYFSRHAVELPREIQPLETAEEHETFLSPNGDYIDNGMVLINPFCQETLFLSREKAYKS